MTARNISIFLGTDLMHKRSDKSHHPTPGAGVSGKFQNWIWLNKTMENWSAPGYKQHSLHWKTILPDLQPYAMKSNFCCCRMAYKKGKKDQPIVLKNFLVHGIPRLPILSLNQMILSSWSKSRSPTGWTKSLKLRNTDVEISSNHLKK